MASCRQDYTVRHSAVPPKGLFVPLALFPPSSALPSFSLTTSSNTNRSRSSNSAQFCASPSSFSFRVLASSSFFHFAVCAARSLVICCKSVCCLAMDVELVCKSRARACKSASMGDITDERDAETAALASAMRCVSVTAVEDDGGELDEDEGVCC